jgi:hypothetical protein
MPLPDAATLPKLILPHQLQHLHFLEPYYAKEVAHRVCQVFVKVYSRTWILLVSVNTGHYIKQVVFFNDITGVQITFYLTSILKGWPETFLEFTCSN